MFMQYPAQTELGSKHGSTVQMNNLLGRMLCTFYVEDLSQLQAN